MTAPIRSQAGPKATARAQARRRVADQMAEAEAALGAYIAASEAAERMRAQAGLAEERKAEALVALASHVGVAMAADMAQVDERIVRAAQAPRRPSSAGRVAARQAVGSPGEQGDRREGAEAGARS
jgi:hypothetical protein